MSTYQIQQLLGSSKAKYIDSAKADILGALREFKELNPTTQNFMFPDGKRRTAFTLDGTIPVHYKGNVYNIPIAVYLWDTHPYYAPICFVKPTSTMVVRESETVNKEGRIYLPYLNEWRFPGYDLNGLLQVMACVFQEKCPVFAKPSSSSVPKVNSSTASAAQQTPYPTASPVGMPAPLTNNGPSFPTTTPYPTSPYVNTPGAGQFMPTRPPPPIPPPHVPDDHIRLSLISALEDKLKFRLREQLGTNYAEMQSIGQIKKDLQKGQQTLKKMIGELDGANRELIQFSTVYEQKKEELVKAASRNGSESSNIDQAIDATTPLHKQLLENYANDLACDDAIYYLGQALIKGVLTPQDYLKHVRSVSRKQFEHRATMQKCRRVAGLTL